LLFTPHSDGGTVELIQDILGEGNLLAQMWSLFPLPPKLRKLAGSPGGIYYASAPEVAHARLPLLPLPQPLVN